MIWLGLVATAVVGCEAVPSQDGGDLGGAADLASGGGDKADGATAGIEVVARIKPGATDVTALAAMPRQGFVFFAAEGSTVSLEVTHTGTSSGLDTQLKVYGPRLADGSYPKTLAADDDGGYGKLSKVSGFTAPVSGFYLAEVAATATGAQHARLAMSCTGTCDSPGPVGAVDEGLKWYRLSAERRALTLQTYAFASEKLQQKIDAGAPSNWAVVLDVDETSLDNSPYQQARAALGTGFSPASWSAWTSSRAAAAIPGVVAFTQLAKNLGGSVVLVTNRKAGAECDATEDNLKAVGVAYDAIYCQDGPSDKNPRFDALSPALAPIMFVGDNILDFPKQSQDIRNQGDDAFADFGDRFVVIPNPMYGSFDKN